MGELLILKAGHKPPTFADIPGDYDQWIAAGMGRAARVVDLERGESPPALDGVAAAVITGSAAMVSERLPWMLAAEAWLRQAVTAGLPLLGICFGHQLMARALGGVVDFNPAGLEVGTTPIHLTAEAAADPLLGGLPARFPAQVSHRQSVLSLPPGARRLAWSGLDRHQAFAVGARAWGLQFHPEFDRRVSRRFVEHYRTRLAEEGRDAAGLLAACAETPESAGLLARFAAIAFPE